MTHPQRLEEPLVLARYISFLKEFLHRLLCVLSLRRFFEGLSGADALEPLEFERIAGREEVGAVDGLSTNVHRIIVTVWMYDIYSNSKV